MTCPLLTHQSLKRFNTLKLDALASFVYLPLSQEDLIEVLKKDHQHFVIIGKGSNIFLKKDVYDEHYAFIITELFNQIELNETEIICEAGTSLNQLAWFCAQRSISGYAFCEDIPGTIGGALIMNAGQYEFTISQYVNWIDVYDLKTQKIERIYPSVSFFSYRHSSFTQDQIILKASLKINKGQQMDILEDIYRYKHNRYEKQPLEYANAGSVFKRPTKDGKTLYVWKCLERCGLRAYRINDAMISEKHPGFIVNLKNAQASDISALIDECQKRVKESFDVDLELEWKVIE